MSLRGCLGTGRAAPAARNTACSCSYTIPVQHVANRKQQHSLPCRPLELGQGWRLEARNRRGKWRCAASSEPQEDPSQDISGYTPANYITYSEDPRHVAPHSVSILVNAPPRICYELWHDWNRLVEFLDLVAQIGLDHENPDMALFQCFYRHGMLPVMEVVFLLERTEAVQDKKLSFESVWGCPISGTVTFTEQPNNQTLVQLSFSNAIPNLLLDLKVGVFGVQNSLRPVLSDNMVAFRSLAEAAAEAEREGRPGGVEAALPPRQEPGPRYWEVFDEEKDILQLSEALDKIDFDAWEEEVRELRREYEESKRGEEQAQAGTPQGQGAADGGASAAGSSSRQGAAQGQQGPGTSAQPADGAAAAAAAAAGGAAVAAGAAGRKRASRATTESGTGKAAAGGARRAAARGSGEALEEAPGPAASAKRRSAKPKGVA